MDAEQAIHSFWSSFGLTAYDENSVPDDATLPYITYSVSYDTFGRSVELSASIWDRTTTWAWLTSLSKQIGAQLDGGKYILTDKGAVLLTKSSPFYIRMGDEDKSIKRIIFNISAEYIEN